MIHLLIPFNIISYVQSLYSQINSIVYPRSDQLALLPPTMVCSRVIPHLLIIYLMAFNPVFKLAEKPACPDFTFKVYTCPKLWKATTIWFYYTVFWNEINSDGSTELLYPDTLRRSSIYLGSTITAYILLLQHSSQYFPFIPFPLNLANPLNIRSTCTQMT